MANDKETVLARGIPSVQTYWRGSGTVAALTQAFVICVAVGVLLSLTYLAISSQIGYWDWHVIFTWAGLLPCLALTWRFWRNPREPAPEFWSRPDRIWLYGPVIWLGNFWPLLIYLFWTKAVNVLAAKFSTEPAVAVGASFLIGAFIGGALLIFRLGSELIEPLRGNAIEPMVKRMELDFERWKTQRGVDVDALRAQNQALQAEINRLSNQLKIEASRTRVVYKSNNERVTEYSDDYIDNEDLFDQFVRAVWGGEDLNRDQWVEKLYDPKTERPAEGRKRYDGYRQVLANAGLWNWDANRHLGTLEQALEAVSDYNNNPPTPPAG